MRHLFLLLIAAMLSACGAMYEEQVQPPTQQELNDARLMLPNGALQRGVFHMQRIRTSSPVLVEPNIKLKRPDLPPFDVAYLNRDLESVILELANAAGESVSIPQGIRGRTVSLVHSGANFQEMLDIVLNKAGYSYNYVDGVWQITRFPVRNYLLEISQSERQGSIIGDSEVTGDESSLDTTYNDQIWDQVDSIMPQLVEVGASEASAGQASSNSNPSAVADASSALPATADLLGDSGSALEQQVNIEGVLATLTPDGNLRPLEITAPGLDDYLAPEEDAQPWYKITRSAGLITVRAAPEAHRMVEEYLEQVQESALRQVLVEARILAIIQDKTTDVGLEATNSGRSVGNSLLANFGFTTSDPYTTNNNAGGFLNLFGSNSSSITGIVQALGNVADVYTISSPSLLARNNQLSRVSITREIGYVETEVESTSSGTNTTVSNRTDTALFKDAGTVLSVFPFIGKNKVQMRVRLSVASQVGTVVTQTSIGDTAPAVNQVPELSSNVIDQDMVLSFGRVYAIGGLIETSTDVNNTYIPGLNNIPGLGEIFQRANNQKQDTEFVVLMKVSRA